MSAAINSVEMSHSADEIRERVRAAGVVGAGVKLQRGRDFPAHVKVDAMWQQAARLVRARTP